MNGYVFAATGATALVLAIAACAMDEGMKPASGLCSTPKQHCINVYVVGSTIKVDVDPLYVYGPDHEIFWQLDRATANGYTFTPNGIVFPGSAVPEFPGCRPIQGGVVFSCPDRNTRPGTYKYTINLTGPRPVPALDPQIINN
jgi:hypothetical protein